MHFVYPYTESIDYLSLSSQRQHSENLFWIRYIELATDIDSYQTIMSHWWLPNDILDKVPSPLSIWYPNLSSMLDSVSIDMCKTWRVTQINSLNERGKSIVLGQRKRMTWIVSWPLINGNHHLEYSHKQLARSVELALLSMVIQCTILRMGQDKEPHRPFFEGVLYVMQHTWYQTFEFPRWVLNSDRRCTWAGTTSCLEASDGGKLSVTYVPWTGVCICNGDTYILTRLLDEMNENGPRDGGHECGRT